MRIVRFVAVPALALAFAMPAQAQIAVRAHIDLPVARRAPRVVVARPPLIRRLSIVAYSARDFGAWQRSYVNWAPVTVYYLDGRYFDVPVPRARPVRVYRDRDRDRYFFAPRDREFQRRHRDDHGRWGR